MDHTKKDTLNVASTKNLNDRVEAQSNGNWINGILVIPTLCPSTIENALGSNIINISYMLEFEYSIEGPHLSKKISIPIVIGTVPLISRSSIDLSALPLDLDYIPRFSYRASI